MFELMNGSRRAYFYLLIKSFLVMKHLNVVFVCEGNGVTGCSRGECTSLQHHTCPDDRACYDSTCIGEFGPNIQRRI